MANYNAKSISYGGNTFNLYPSNLNSETLLQNQAEDATEVADRVYPVRMDANGKLAVNVPWESSAAGVITVEGTVTNTSGSYSGTFSDSRIAPDMKCVELELGTPSIFGDEISVTTSAGSVTISCSAVVGSSTFKAAFIASAMNSTEFNALDSKITKLDSMAVLNNNITDFLKPAGSGQTAVYSVYGTIGGLFPSWAWGTLYVLEQQAIFDGAEATANGSIANACYVNGTWTNISNMTPINITSEFELGNTITLAYIGAFSVYKIGRIIQMYFRGKTSSSGNDPIIATVPSKYRPINIGETTTVFHSAWNKNDVAAVNYYNAVSGIVFAAKCYTTDQDYVGMISWIY